ncbi:beta strand repeat-containing protein [Paludisphaera borealis]|uniref:beta strand repeat-containing protein n=1 Tax=Paludisphaera borealis TaxID=1387353 RepID=UPI000970EA1D|nr:hypothetical protein [Paludisphaera borealis]
MTWLSRLLPATPSLHRHAATLNRTTKQRRRVMTLENLEQRLVLSNVSASFSAGILTINADQFNNSFKITETTAAAGGKVTVSSLTPATTINSTAAAYQTPSAVTAIKVNLVGTTDSDVIQLVGAGKTTATTVKTVDFTVDKTYLNLSVNNVDNTGAFTLTTKGKLTATVLNSTFTALSIDQSQGCCLATVELGNDAIAGSVSVKEGSADKDVINVHDSKLGSTYLAQGNGNGDTITVTNNTVKDLTVCQGNGNGDSISVDGLKIASTSFGVITTQGNGNNDTTTINNVTVTGLVPNNPQIIPSIYVTQGNGNGDTASVTNSIVPGNISICQGDGNNDSASITDSSAGFVIKGYLYFGNVSIKQGNGAQDQAVVSGVNANNVYVCQGNGNEDFASVTSSKVNGCVLVTQGNGGPINNDLFGDIAIVDGVTGLAGTIKVSQGDGNYDQASVTNSDAQWGIFICQGNGNGDWAMIDTVSTLYGAIAITQGNGGGDYASISNALAACDISICQGNGGSDAALINTVTSSNGSVWITQGNGGGDYASISNADAYCNISICQGNGDGDQAFVSSSTAGGNISITQGNGNGDTAVVDSSTAGWNITICQGDGNLDTASVTNSTAVGYLEPVYDNAGNLLYFIDCDGNISITQGNGYGDTANVDGDSANNVYVCQGDNIFTPDCDGYPGDTVNINDSIITSDIVIHQGSSDAVGGYLVNIGDQSPVTAGGYTLICQNGAGNTVILGSDSSSFETAYLDVNTGAGGGGFVMATNTTVDWGSYFGFDFTIDGGGDGNTFFDAGGNDGVTASANYNVV